MKTRDLTSLKLNHALLCRDNTRIRLKYIYTMSSSVATLLSLSFVVATPISLDLSFHLNWNAHTKVLNTQPRTSWTTFYCNLNIGGWVFNIIIIYKWLRNLKAIIMYLEAQKFTIKMNVYPNTVVLISLKNTVVSMNKNYFMVQCCQHCYKIKLTLWSGGTLNVIKRHNFN